jgi:hypothetical protein
VSFRTGVDYKCSQNDRNCVAILNFRNRKREVIT